jgi:hypothetical protein
LAAAAGRVRGCRASPAAAPAQIRGIHFERVFGVVVVMVVSKATVFFIRSISFLCCYISFIFICLNAFL